MGIEIAELNFSNSETISKKFANTDLINIMTGFGEVIFPCLDYICPDKEKLFNHAPAYTPELGKLHIRELIADHYSKRLGVKLLPTQIVITPGSKMLLFNLLQSIPGDVIIPIPSWPTYFTQAKLLNKKIINFKLDTSYNPDANQLASLITNAKADGGNPKILILNTPNNPTGVTYDKDTIKKIVKVCEEHGVFIISDEVYADLIYQSDTHYSPYLVDQKNVAIVMSVSKSFSGGGWRGGYGILPLGETGQKIAGYIQAVSGATWSSCSSLSQHIIQSIFEQEEKMNQVHTVLRALLNEIATTMFRFFEKNNILTIRPGGAFYFYIDFFNYCESLLALYNVKTSRDLELILENAGLPVLAGSKCGDNPYKLSVRISFGQLIPLDLNKLMELINATQEERSNAIKKMINDAENYRLFVNRITDFIHKLK